LSHQYDGMDVKLWTLQLEKLLQNVPEPFEVHVKSRYTDKSPPPTPSAPALDSPGSAQGPTAPSLEECVVCMDAQVNLILLHFAVSFK
jgi:hypothetical protein